MSDKMQNLLLKSFDTQLSDDEQKQLDAALKASHTLQLEKEQFELVRQTLSKVPPPRFRPFFTERVMARVNTADKQANFESLFDSLIIAFRPLAISAAVIILGLMSFNAIQNHQSFLSGLFPSTTLEQAFDPALTYFQE